MNRFNSLETQYNMLKVGMVHTVYYMILFVVQCTLSITFCFVSSLLLALYELLCMLNYSSLMMDV